MKQRWLRIWSLLLPLAFVGCAPFNSLEQHRRLESTVVAMQTDVAIELAEVRDLVSTPMTGPTSTPSLTPCPSIPTGTPTSEPTSPPGGTVTADMLNLRSGPGLEYDVMAHLQKGDAVDVEAQVEAGDWVKVSTVEGLEGWLAVEHLTLGVPLDGIPVALEIPPTPTLGPTVPVTVTATTVPLTTTVTPVCSEE